MKPKEKRYTVSLEVKLTPAGMQELRDAHAQSTCQSLAEYVRRLLFRKDITVLTRNRSLDDFIGEGIRLRKELQAIREKLPFSPEGEVRLLDLMEEIKINIYKIAELCTQK
jgi:hypothetical protein